MCASIGTDSVGGGECVRLFQQMGAAVLQERSGLSTRPWSVVAARAATTSRSAMLNSACMCGTCAGPRGERKGLTSFTHRRPRRRTSSSSSLLLRLALQRLALALTPPLLVVPSHRFPRSISVSLHPIRAPSPCSTEHTASASYQRTCVDSSLHRFPPLAHR